MAKITRISAQKKKGRYNIFLDGDYAFGVDEDILVKFALRKGMELDEAAIKALQEKDITNKFYVMSINLLSYRMRSEKEIADYLKKKEAEPEQINEVIVRLKREGYVNNQDFAYGFVQSRMISSSKGPLLIKKELLEKGVSQEQIENALTLFSHEEQVQKIHKFIEKKLGASSKKSFQQQLINLQTTLMQKGYAPELIKGVLAETKDEYRDEDAEKEAVVHQGLKLLAKYNKKAEGYELKQKIKAALYRKGFQGDWIDSFIEEYVKEEN
ncbi:recombination regulator RecX [Salirhabdus sp. Marseille-P4669]|uniref:recombination regulator RecX n=1 Tax=Salirhabdus sp. Marseille-P4669 TaxID=2042310 RepID=UPI000C7A3E66|nr:recombination regulator RecX [Salirhabdus sp. Marseille-P4669]